MELYDVAEESFTMEIVVNDPDVMDDKKIIYEMKKIRNLLVKAHCKVPIINYQMKPLGLDVVIAATQITTMLDQFLG